MTGNRHNREGNSGEEREPDPGPYWRRMHLDWRFWVGALFMAAAIAIYVMSGDLAWIPRSQPQSQTPATTTK
jgi:hypothetical protein